MLDYDTYMDFSLLSITIHQVCTEIRIITFTISIVLYNNLKYGTKACFHLSLNILTTMNVSKKRVLLIDNVWLASSRSPTWWSSPPAISCLSSPTTLLVKNLYLSCDPYMRSQMSKLVGSYNESLVPAELNSNIATLHMLE